jgi:hypothetical protein
VGARTGWLFWEVPKKKKKKKEAYTTVKTGFEQCSSRDGSHSFILSLFSLMADPSDFDGENDGGCFRNTLDVLRCHVKGEETSGIRIGQNLIE